MKHKLTLQDIQKARLDIEAKRQFNRKGIAAPFLSGKAKMAVKAFARDTYHLAAGKGISPVEWEDRIARILRTRNKRVRDAILAKLEEQQSQR